MNRAIRQNPQLGKTTFYTTADFERALRRSSEGLIKLKQDGTRGKYIAEKKGKKTTEFILTKQFIKEQYK